MTTASTQTVWAELLVTTLADAGVTLCVVSPGSRSTPLVAALAREPRIAKVTLVDERTAAFYALGAARAAGPEAAPVALVCTSGTAAAHYLPALIEASQAHVPLVAITADRPPELHGCGASQTIPQVGLYGDFVRGAFDLGAPVATTLALRALRRTVIQALTRACGPVPGPVHLEVPLRKPLEPAGPTTEAERAFACEATQLAGAITLAPPRLAADAAAIARAAAVLGAEADGVIVAGALRVGTFVRAALFALAARTGYPIVAEAGSQLRYGPRPPGVTVIEQFDLIAEAPLPRVLVEVGADPVAASWPGFLARAVAAGATRVVLSGPAWRDPDSSSGHVILGDVAAAATALTAQLSGDRTTSSSPWAALDARAAAALALALTAPPGSEVAVVRAALGALPAGAALQVGNSLAIRVIDHAGGLLGAYPVLTQRGAAGIDGLIASAAGATRAGAPVLLVLGDVSFAHDVGSLLAARAAVAPLAILVIDNGGGQIFAGLPVARAALGDAFTEHWLTPTALDPVVVAAAFGVRGVAARAPAEVRIAVATALAAPGTTIIHAPVSPSGAHDVRRAAIELFATGATS